VVSICGDCLSFDVSCVFAISALRFVIHDSSSHPRISRDDLSMCEEKAYNSASSNSFSFNDHGQPTAPTSRKHSPTSENTPRGPALPTLFLNRNLDRNPGPRRLPEATNQKDYWIKSMRHSRGLRRGDHRYGCSSSRRGLLRAMRRGSSRSGMPIKRGL